MCTLCATCILFAGCRCGCSCVPGLPSAARSPSVRRPSRPLPPGPRLPGFRGRAVEEACLAAVSALRGLWRPAGADMARPGARGLARLLRAVPGVCPSARAASGGRGRAWQQPTGRDTGVQVYNSRTGRKEPLVVARADSTSWWVGARPGVPGVSAGRGHCESASMGALAPGDVEPFSQVRLASQVQLRTHRVRPRAPRPCVVSVLPSNGLASLGKHEPPWVSWVPSDVPRCGQGALAGRLPVGWVASGWESQPWEGSGPLGRPAC